MSSPWKSVWSSARHTEKPSTKTHAHHPRPHHPGCCWELLGLKAWGGKGPQLRNTTCLKADEGLMIQSAFTSSCPMSFSYHYPITAPSPATPLQQKGLTPPCLGSSSSSCLDCQSHLLPPLPPASHPTWIAQTGNHCPSSTGDSPTHLRAPTTNHLGPSPSPCFMGIPEAVAVSCPGPVLNTTGHS